MDNSKTNKEFVFWLHCIRRSVWTYASRTELMKCTINCDLVSAEGFCQKNKGNLVIQISRIKSCEISVFSPSLIGAVIVTTTDENKYRFIPSNPFLPGANNESEMRAMAQIINAFLSGESLPDLERNPYKRQIMTRNIPQYAKEIPLDEWDSNISPIIYINKYNPKVGERSRQVDRFLHVFQFLIMSIIILGWLWVILHLVSQ